MKQRTLLLVENHPVDKAFAKQAMSRSPPDGRVPVVQNKADVIDLLSEMKPDGARDRSALLTNVFPDIDPPKMHRTGVPRRPQTAKHRYGMPTERSSYTEGCIITDYRPGATIFNTELIDHRDFIKTMIYLGSYRLILNEPLPEIGRN